MATCYICSASYATHRRQVYTGESKRVNYGKRIAIGNSRYYGMRTVCADCAKQIDYNRQARIVVLQCLVIAFLLYIYFQ